MPLFTKNPIEVEAMQWTGDNDAEIHAWLDEPRPDTFRVDADREHAYCWVKKHSTIGEMKPGDWIIREPDGNGYYPVSTVDFALCYEPVEG